MFPLTSIFPPSNHHPLNIILRKGQAIEGVEKGQPGWPPEVGARRPAKGARPIPPSDYKRPPLASNFFTQAFQKTTQVSVFSFKRKSSSEKESRGEEKSGREVGSF